MGLILTAAPSGEPVTRAEAKEHCRVDGTDDDALIDALIVAARRLAETLTGRALVTQSWKLLLDAFPVEAIKIPLPPLQSIGSIKYLDADGNQQTFASNQYIAFTTGQHGIVAPVYGVSWPATRDQREAVEVTFTAGYGNAAAVPQEAKQWMLLAIGGWYSQRESLAVGSLAPETLPRGMWDALLDGYRVVSFA